MGLRKSKSQKGPFAHIGLVVLVLATLSAAAGQNLVVNGSFETNACTGSGAGYQLGLVGTAVTGWVIQASDGTYPWCLQNSNAFSAGPTPYGNQWLVLGEVATSVAYTIQQTLNGLTPGGTYHLSFAIASEEGCCSIVEVSFPSGSSTAAQTFTAPTSGTGFWMNWTTQTTSFIATSSSVTLQFKNLVSAQTGGFDLGLDNVVVSSGSGGSGGVQISFAPSFNADPVLRCTGTVCTGPSTSFDGSTNTGFLMLTQSAANQFGGVVGNGNIISGSVFQFAARKFGLAPKAAKPRASSNNPVGVNDDGVYAATGTRNYDVKLGFTDTTGTGTSTVIRENTVGGGFSFGVPPNQYSQFALFGSSGNSGSLGSTLTITMNYSSGSPVVMTGVSLPDWFSGPGSATSMGPAGSHFALTPAMSREHETGGILDAYTDPVAGPTGGAYIYGINLVPDPTRMLASVSVQVTGLATPGTTVANFFTAAGSPVTTTMPATPAPSSFWLVLLGLAGVGLYHVGRMKEALFRPRVIALG